MLSYRRIIGTKAGMKVQVRVRKELLSGTEGVQAVIRQLAQEYATGCGMAGRAQELADSALEREASEPTYVGRGLAIPHARVEGWEEAGVYVAQSEEGIPWPEEAARLIILLTVPAETPGLYLQILSRLVRWRMKGGETTAPAIAQALACGLYEVQAC